MLVIFFFSSRVGLFTARFLLFLQKKWGKRKKFNDYQQFSFFVEKGTIFLAARFARNFPSQIILTKSCVRKCSLSGIKGKMTII